MTRNAFILMPAKAVEAVLLLVMSALYTRLFPKEVNGLYQGVNATVLVLFLVTSAWLYNASARFVSEYRSEEGKKKFYSTFVLTFGLISLLCLLVGGLLWATLGNVLYFAASMMLCSYSLFTIMNGLLIQNEKIMVSIGVSLLNVGGKILVTLLLVSLGGNQTPLPAIFGAVASDLVAATVAMAVLRAAKNTRPRHFSKSLLTDLLVFGVPLIGMSVGTGLLTQIDRFIVMFMKGAGEFAVYSTNYVVSSGVFGMIAAAVIRAMYPSLIQSYTREGRLAAEKLFTQGARLYFLIGMPACLGLCAVSMPLSQVMFEKTYWPGGNIIGIAAMAYFFMDLAEYAVKGFELTKNTKPVLWYSLAAATVKIIATFGLTYLLGIQGAAWGTLVAFFLYLVILIIFMRPVFTFHIDWKSTLRILFAALLCFGAAWGTVQFLPAGTLVKLVVAVLAGGGTYIAAILLSGELKPELQMLRAARQGKKNS